MRREKRNHPLVFSFSVSPQARSPFSTSLQTFCCTIRAYWNKQKYGLFAVYEPLKVVDRSLVPDKLDLPYISRLRVRQLTSRNRKRALRKPTCKPSARLIIRILNTYDDFVFFCCLFHRGVPPPPPIPWFKSNSFPGSTPFFPGKRVGENPGNKVGSDSISTASRHVCSDIHFGILIIPLRHPL